MLFRDYNLQLIRIKHEPEAASFSRFAFYMGILLCFSISSDALYSLKFARSKKFFAPGKRNYCYKQMHRLPKAKICLPCIASVFRLFTKFVGKMEKPLVDKQYLLDKFPGKGGWTYTLYIQPRPEAEHVRNQVNAPEGWVMACFLAIGYAAENAVLPKQRPFNPEDKIHINVWK